MIKQNHGLLNDFDRTLHFNNILSQRKAKSPLYLNRLIRRKKSRIFPDCLRVDIAYFTSPYDGRLIFQLLSVDILDAYQRHVVKHSHQSIDIEKNEEFHSDVFLQFCDDVDSNDSEPHSFLLLVVFKIISRKAQETKFEDDSNIVDAVISKFFKTANTSSTGYTDEKILFNLIELHPFKTRIISRSECNLDYRQSFRSQFTPSLASMCSYKLSTRKPSVNLMRNITMNRGNKDNSIKLMMKWVNRNRSQSETHNQMIARPDKRKLDNSNYFDSRFLKKKETNGSTIINEKLNHSLSLYYHFLYSDSNPAKIPLVNRSKKSCISKESNPATTVTKSMIENKKCLSCAWCSVELCIHHNDIRVDDRGHWSHTTKYNITSLLLHLKSVHFQFCYECFIDDAKNLHIIMKRNEIKEDIDHIQPYFFSRFMLKYPEEYQDVCPNLTFFIYGISLHLPEAIKDFQFEQASMQLKCKFKINRKKMIQNTPRPSKDVTNKGDADEKKFSPDHLDSLNRFFPNDHANNRLLYNRQYYHPIDGSIVKDYNYDSDDDVDSSWYLWYQCRNLEEFEDVAFEEKEFMKLWNIHVATFPPYSDSYLPIICERFVQRFAYEILRKGLRHNCLVHFLNMWDYSLIRADEVRKYMDCIDNFQETQIIECNDHASRV
jgi:hypothetical protein